EVRAVIVGRASPGDVQSLPCLTVLVEREGVTAVEPCPRESRVGRIALERPRLLHVDANELDRGAGRLELIMGLGYGVELRESRQGNGTRLDVRALGRRTAGVRDVIHPIDPDVPVRERTF